MAAEWPEGGAIEKRRWWIAALLFFAGLINYFDRTALSVALPAIAHSMGLGPERMGVLLSAFFWSYALMQAPIGWLADRVNLRWLYAGCFALWSVAAGLTGLASSLAMLLLLRVLLGIGESIYLPGGMKMVSMLFEPERRGFASGLVNCGTRLGLAIGAPLIAALVVAVGWRESFFLLGFAGMIWLGPWLVVSRKLGVGSKELEVRRQSQLVSGVLSRSLIGICIANIGYGYYFYLLVTWLPTYLVESRHLGLQTAGAYAVVPYLTFALAEPLGGWIADRLIAQGWEETFARKVIITVGYASGLLLLPAGLTASMPAAAALLGGAALVGLSSGNLYALVQKSSPGSVGLAVGLFNFSGNVPGIIAPIVTGLLVARTGSYFPAFVVAVTVLLAVTPLYWALVRETPLHSSPFQR